MTAKDQEAVIKILVSLSPSARLGLLVGMLVNLMEQDENENS